MQWLTQNWIWIVFFIGVLLLLRRGGMACGMGHSGHRSGVPGDEQKSPNVLKDAVSGEAVNAATALTSVYQEHTYYFASRENRERFEAAPAQYASSHDAAGGHGHHRHGC